MGKKRYRPRTAGNAGNTGNSGNSGNGRSGYGGRPGGGPGGGPGYGGNNRPARRRRYDEVGPEGGGFRPRAPKDADAGRDEPDTADAPDVADDQLSEFTGCLELHPHGYGFLRAAENAYAREPTDPFVPSQFIEKYNLADKQGVEIRGVTQPGRKGQGPRVREVLEIAGLKPDDYVDVPDFEDLTAVNPDEWYRLETGPEPLTTRVMDLLTPLGKGQRALIVAPPRSGKTIMLQHIAHGIAENYPESKLMVLLIDERPEEVTDMKRTVKGEVLASSLDEDIDSHVRLAQFVIDRAKRLAEAGQHVFLLLDSLTRLARAFNKHSNSGRTMSGGIDIKALDIPKKLFATARSFEEGGSLTIVATALVDTGTRGDEVIFQEFKGTGNMELALDRHLADRRIFPAIDISLSGTRREELLLDEDSLNAVTLLRRTLIQMNPVEAMEELTKQLARRKSNGEFLALIAGVPAAD